MTRQESSARSNLEMLSLGTRCSTTFLYEVVCKVQQISKAIALRKALPGVACSLTRVAVPVCRSTMPAEQGHFPPHLRVQDAIGA